MYYYLQAAKSRHAAMMYSTATDTSQYGYEYGENKEKRCYGQKKEHFNIQHKRIKSQQ